MRPEDIDYPRPVSECHSCSDLAAEMAAALAAASIVFKDSKSYSQKLVRGATTLFKFSRDQRGRYSSGGTDASVFYNSTSYWDEFVWGGAWMYLATGNSSYLQLATHPVLAKHAGAFWGGPDYGVFSWDNKLTGAQVSDFDSCVLTYYFFFSLTGDCSRCRFIAAAFFVYYANSLDWNPGGLNFL